MGYWGNCKNFTGAAASAEVCCLRVVLDKRVCWINWTLLLFLRCSTDSHIAALRQDYRLFTIVPNCHSLTDRGNPWSVARCQSFDVCRGCNPTGAVKVYQIAGSQASWAVILVNPLKGERIFYSMRRGNTSVDGDAESRQWCGTEPKLGQWDSGSVGQMSCGSRLIG